MAALALACAVTAFCGPTTPAFAREPWVVVPEAGVADRYAFFLPGLVTVCWDPAEYPGAVAYEVETRNLGLPEDTGVSLLRYESPAGCTRLALNAQGDYAVRVRGVGPAPESWPTLFGVSTVIRVRAQMDANKDGVVGVPDFSTIREVYGLCHDWVGYHRCPRKEAPDDAPQIAPAPAPDPGGAPAEDRDHPGDGPRPL